MIHSLLSEFNHLVPDVISSHNGAKTSVRFSGVKEPRIFAAMQVGMCIKRPWTQLSSQLSWMLKQNVMHQHFSAAEKTYPESRLMDRSWWSTMQAIQASRSQNHTFLSVGAHERFGVPVKSTNTSSTAQSHFGFCGRVHDGFNGLVRAIRSIHKFAKTYSEAQSGQFQHLLQTQ
jgi:hypothetical protein